MIGPPIEPLLMQPLMQYRHDGWQVMVSWLVQPSLVQPSLVQPSLVQLSLAKPLLVQRSLVQHCNDDWPADGAVVGAAIDADAPARTHISSEELRLLRQVLEPAVLRSQCI